MTCLLQTEINPQQKAGVGEELNQKWPGNNTNQLFPELSPKNKAQGWAETEPNPSLNKSTCC